MKKAALIVLIFTVLAAGVVVYALFHTALLVEGTALQAFPATEREAEFSVLRQEVSQNSLHGTMLRNVSLGESGDYRYRVYTLRLKNPCLVPAQMVEIQIAPIGQDILFYGQEEEIDIAPGETRDLWCVLLTEGDTHDVREMKITYYLWGHPHEVRFTYDE